MSREVVENSFRTQLANIGRNALSALYPNDINLALIALELVDSNGSTVDYFAWPIMPSEIRETHQEITNIRKTIGGVYVLKNTTFAPRQISLSGTFGRRFKLLINGKQLELAGFRFSINSGKINIDPPNFLDKKVPEFSSFAKNGYGCIKIIEAMKEKSKKLDANGKPYSLYFYNPLFGNNYQIEIINFSHMQDENAHNMLPAYSLQCVAVAPLDSVLSRLSNINSALKNITFASLQKGANAIVSNLKGLKKLKLTR